MEALPFLSGLFKAKWKISIFKYCDLYFFFFYHFFSPPPPTPTTSHLNCDSAARLNLSHLQRRQRATGPLMVRRSTFKGNKSAHPDPGRFDLPTRQTRGVVRSPIVPVPRSRSLRPGLIDMKSSGERRNLSVFSGCARSTQRDITQSPPPLIATPPPPPPRRVGRGRDH